MQKRKLGNTDIMVSKICLGTMNWGYQNNQQEAHDQLDYGVSRGINFIDTAEIYAIPPSAETQWLTEKYIWNWLHSRKNRSDIILWTKASWSIKNNPWAAHVRNGEGVTASWIIMDVEWSLQRLQSDYIDLYQLHWPQSKVPIFGRMNFH